MLRSIRPVLLGLAVLTAASEQARAQYYYPYGYGWNGYGFGGWGGTVQGSVLRGMGAYAEGAGVYNYDTSVAGSINTDTAIRLNQYMWNSELEARRRWNAHQARRLNLSKDEYKARMSKIRNNPEPIDIDSGEALNDVLDQMTDPKIMTGSSTLRMANSKLNSNLIREIPFRDETDAITISLDQLTDAKSWPLPLRADAFKTEREAYQKAVDEALAEDTEGGTLKPETIGRLRSAVGALYAKVEATIPKTQQPDHLQAMNYLKGLAGLSRMLEKPSVESVLAELEKIENTTVGNLVAFMHSYNLRFAPATTAKQKAAYRELYPILAGERTRIVGKPAENEAAAASQAQPQPIDNPTAIFYGLDPKHLNPTPPPAPTPAKP